MTAERLPWISADPASMHLYELAQKVAAAPPKVREIAWKAQSHLNRRYRALIKRGKRKNVAITAVARELAGFVWAVAREVASAERAAK